MRRATPVALLFSFCLLFCLFFSSGSQAKGIYQTTPEFLAEVFQAEEPEQKFLWLTPALKDSAKKIIGHTVRGIRLRYWQTGEKTAWVMEEIGKELPITIGVVINQNQVEQVKILAFRESRGWEVRYPAFTAQYRDVKITPDNKLDAHIDGITGATLSVRAVSKVTTLALYYHRHLMSALKTTQKTTLSTTPTDNKENNQLVTESP